MMLLTGWKNSMFWKIFVVFISLEPFLPTSSQSPSSNSIEQNEVSFNKNSATTTTSPPPTMLPFSVEILALYVAPAFGNVVEVIWGGGFERSVGANFSYGLHYGEDEGELEYPKLVTTNLSASVDELEYCTRYLFAVTVQEGGGEEAMKVNLNTVRSIITGINPLNAPTNLTADLDPGESPCLLVKWSASCPNVVYPVGYVLSFLEKNLSRYKIETFSPTKHPEMVHRFPVKYGETYEIRVSTNFPGSKAAGPITYQLPDHLQPFKLRIAVNKEEEAFMIYWEEPFVPLRVGRYYYQVYVFPGQDTEAPYEKYYVTRPVMVYKGPLGQYSFAVNLASQDRKHISKKTQPIYANLNGDTFALNVTLPDKLPDDNVDDKLSR